MAVLCVYTETESGVKMTRVKCEVCPSYHCDVKITRAIPPEFFEQFRCITRVRIPRVDGARVVRCSWLPFATQVAALANVPILRSTSYTKLNPA